MKYETIQLGVAYDLPAPETPLPSAETRSSNDALIMSVNFCGCVDLPYMARYAGKTTDELLADLRGKAIVQDPAVFVNDDYWSKEKGWVLLAPYLTGVVSEKLKLAERMNARFPGRFIANIHMLRKVLPPQLLFNEIYVGLGARWVPAFIYEQFVQELLHLRLKPHITFSKELSAWKIEPPAEAKRSVCNTLTYGIQEMPAVKIIEKTMNAATLKVFDSVLKGYWGGAPHYDTVLNERATLAAQEKQTVILRAFQAWLGKDSTRKQYLEDCYNKAFVGCHTASYREIPLHLPGLNPDITLKPHQKAAVARILLSGDNTLLAHEVGTGKTYIMAVAAHELHRLQLAKKSVLVVPNNVLRAAADAHKLLYQDDNILVVYPKQFTPDKRARVLREIRDGDYTAVYMAYSSFDMITMSKSYWEQKKLSEIRALRNAAACATRQEDRKTMESRADRLSKKLEEFKQTKQEKPWPAFETLGIDSLFLDEAHNYKNIPLFSRTDNIVGMHPKGSAKCAEMLEKVGSVSRVVFATGTPLTNSLSDLYVLQTYLQPEMLRFHGIENFDAWINVFGERETNYEIDVDGKNLRPVTRFSAFHNLDELTAIFSLVCDYHEPAQTDKDVPLFGGCREIMVEKSLMQGEYINDLSRRIENVRSHRVSRKEDNPLKITADGRKCALDIRMVDPELFDETDPTRTKIDACAAQIYAYYRAYPGTCQLVFSDIGTPKAGFNVYDELQRTLTGRYRIPENEIAFVHDASSETARARLFTAMNRGQVRVVIGSTQKLGMGVNVQERLIALHHLSIPWKPSDMVQREGRILRPGNTCEEVFICRYTTKGTFDAYSWQLLENKQRFISNFLSGITAARDVSDIADAVLQYSEIKALTIGDPRIQQRVQTANRLERAKLSARQRQEQLVQLRALKETLPDKQTKLRARLESAEQDHEAYQKRKTAIPQDERLAFGEELLEALRGNAEQNEERFFANYQGFSVRLPAQMLPEKPYILLRSEHGGCYIVDMKDCDKPRGCSSRIDYLLEHLPGQIASLQEDIRQTEQQLREAEADYAHGNRYTAQIATLTAQLEQIDRSLEQHPGRKAL